MNLLSKYLGQKISEYIQCKLLLAISVILIGKIYPFSHSEDLEKLVIHMFQKQLNFAIQNVDFKSDEVNQKKYYKINQKKKIFFRV